MSIEIRVLQAVVREYVQQVDEDDDEDGGLGLAILEKCRAAIEKV